MNKWITALALAGLATTGAAIAQEGPGGGYGRAGGMLRRADTNGDGLVTRAEYQASVEQRFARQDANGNGILDPEERPMRARMSDNAPSPPAASAAASPPARTPVTRAQYTALAMARFDRLDANRDGKLDATELDAAVSSMPARPPRPGN